MQLKDYIGEATAYDKKLMLERTSFLKGGFFAPPVCFVLVRTCFCDGCKKEHEVKLTKVKQAWSQGFVKAVEKAYDRLKLVEGKGTVKQVLRGRAKCASGLLEDIFASEVYDNIVSRNDQYVVLVDWPISYKLQGGRKRTNYHDFILCRKQKSGILQIIYVADLKTNCGYFRNSIGKTYDKMADKLKNLKKAIELTSRNLSEGDGTQFFKCPPSALYDLIIYSSVNSNANFVSQIDTCNKKNTGSKAIVLCDFLNDKETVRADDFRFLEQRIRKQMTLK